MEIVIEKTCAAVNTDHKDNFQHVWYRCFGYQDPNAIKDLIEKGLATGIPMSNCGRREVWKCCVKGKMGRQTLPKKSATKTLYFMETKDETTTFIKQFIEITKTQFNKPPKCIRSDREREYLNTGLQDNLKDRN